MSIIQDRGLRGDCFKQIYILYVCIDATQLLLQAETEMQAPDEECDPDANESSADCADLTCKLQEKVEIYL